MILQKLIILALLICILACSTCYNQHFIPVASINSTAGVKSIESIYAFDSTFQVSSDVYLVFGNCKSFPNGVLCLRVVAPKDRKLRFSSKVFEIQSKDKTADEVHQFGNAEYQVICSIKADGSRECNSPEAFPTTATVTKTVINIFTIHEVTTEVASYSFDPMNQFLGDFEKRGPAFVRIFNPSENWREYRIAMFENSILDSPEFILRLPNIFVDDVEYHLPELKIATSIKLFCPSGV
jgi:hypothetical protein